MRACHQMATQSWAAVLSFEQTIPELARPELLGSQHTGGGEADSEQVWTGQVSCELVRNEQVRKVSMPADQLGMG